MPKWREGLLLLMLTGMGWYLFLAPQQGYGSVDLRAKDAFQQSRKTVMASLSSADQALKSILTN